MTAAITLVLVLALAALLLGPLVGAPAAIGFFVWRALSSPPWDWMAGLGLATVLIGIQLWRLRRPDVVSRLPVAAVFSAAWVFILYLIFAARALDPDKISRVVLPSDLPTQLALGAGAALYTTIYTVLWRPGRKGRPAREPDW